MEKRNYFDLVSSQRYFHLVALKPEKFYSSNDYWSQCGVIQKDKNQSIHEGEGFVIEQKRIITDISFYNGDKDYSLHGNNEAPFHYDLFTIHLLKDNILILGFPFKYLAIKILSRLTDKYDLLRNVAFLRSDLSKLIKNSGDQIASTDEYVSYFSGIDLKLPGDTNVTSVGLDGDRPLESILYKTFFQERILKDECLLDKCTIKFELTNHTPKTRSNIHIDNFGNYKLYVHGTGKNIFTIPYLFRVLLDAECLLPSMTNPIPYISENNF